MNMERETQEADVNGFKIGDIVAIEGRYGGLLKSKVAKIHKNGNIVLAGSPQKYRVWSEKDGVTAHKTGGSVWDTETVRHWSAKHDEKVRRAELAQRWHSAMKTITYRWSVEAATEERVEAIEALAATFEGPPKGA